MFDKSLQVLYSRVISSVTPCRGPCYIISSKEIFLQQTRKTNVLDECFFIIIILQLGNKDIYNFNY